MTDERPKSSEEMLREANSRLRGPHDDSVAETPPPVSPSPSPPEVPLDVEQLEVDYELAGLEKLEREAVIGSHLDPVPITEPYETAPSAPSEGGSRFSRLALRFGLGIVVFAAIGFFSSMNDAGRDGAGDLVRGGEIDVMELQAGDCFNDPSDFEDVVYTVEAVPCSEAHDNEVYSLIPYTLSGTNFPGVSALQDFAYEACSGQPFSDYVGSDYLDSALEVFTFTPTEESWSGGDRSVTCILYNLDLTKLTGTARDSGL